jgi:DNA-binding transcriptional ArsR family regulator
MKRDARSLSLLTAEQFHRVSRAISDRTRYDILCKVFASSGLTCGGAAEGLPISAATASHHIRKLFNAGLVET